MLRNFAYSKPTKLYFGEDSLIGVVLNGGSKSFVKCWGSEFRTFMDDPSICGKAFRFKKQKKRGW